MRINEIFLSVSGEAGAFPQGSWCVFVRLAGCNLRCKWCDTVRAQAYLSGTKMTPASVVGVVADLAQGRINRVLITGGEPLLDKEELPVLIDLLLTYGYRIQIETNGSVMPAEHLLARERVSWVVDYKLPSSGMEGQMLPRDRFIRLLEHGAVIKMVVADRADYDRVAWVRENILNDRWNEKNNLALSAAPPLTHAKLYRWMKADGLIHIRLSVQIHKLAGLNEG